MRASPTGNYRREKIWDPVIRLWHWLLLVSVSSGWLLGKFRDFATVEWHIYLGYCTGILVIIRLIWGFLGPYPVRLRTLLPSHSKIMQNTRYLGSREPLGSPGHSALGALSVVIMLLLLAVQVCTGLFSVDDALFASGPLAGWISSGGVLKATAIHHFVATLLLVFVGIHVAAVLYYLLWKRENLIVPMITGWKWIRVIQRDL